MKVKYDDIFFIENVKGMEIHPFKLMVEKVRLVKHSFNSSLKAPLNLNLSSRVTTGYNISTTPAVVLNVSVLLDLQGNIGGLL